jgi:hypothetical protein
MSHYMSVNTCLHILWDPGYSSPVGLCGFRFGIYSAKIDLDLVYNSKATRPANSFARTYKGAASQGKADWKRREQLVPKRSSNLSVRLILCEFWTIVRARADPKSIISRSYPGLRGCPGEGSTP